MEFAIVTRDEIWSSGSLVERRLSHGIAVARGKEIVASDALDPTLLAAADAEIDSARAAIAHLRGVRVRIVVTARRNGLTSTLTINREGLSVVSTPQHARDDYDLLLECGGPAAALLSRDLPILWRNGSGAVLLHEAAGHAAEHGHVTQWPEWLSVRDEPTMEFDDTGQPATAIDLLATTPRTLRRQTFTDVPLPRMTAVVVRERGAPFDLPQRRVEVDLVAGGRYEPLDGTITIHVSAANCIDGSTAKRVAPFVITESRDSIARSLIGARGEPERYPGVVCSREGQELVVGSRAPLLLTQF